MNNEPNLNNPAPAPQPKNETPETKRCPVCGKDVPAQAAFCGECGYNFQAGSATPYTVPPQAAAEPEDTSPLKVSDYFVMLLVACIPLVNVILLLIWAFSSGTNVNRKNFCRAYLIMMVIMWVISFILSLSLIGLIGILASEELYYGMILPLIFR